MMTKQTIDYKLAKSRLNNETIKKGAGVVVGLGVAAGIGWYVWTRYKKIPLIPSNTMLYLGQAAQFATGTEDILSDGSDTADDALMAVIAKEWDKAFKDIKDLGNTLFDARISNQHALIKISQATISSAQDSLAYYQEKQRANMGAADLITALTFFVAAPWTFSGKVYDQQMVDSAQATLNKTNRTETAKINAYSRNIQDLEKQKIAWNNKTGDMYAEYLSEFASKCKSGVDIPSIKDGLRDKINKALAAIK
jgi:hypothetical protein